MRDSLGRFVSKLNCKEMSEMKTVVNVVEVEKEGFMALLGEQITIFALNYIYTGKLVGVNEDCVKLENASVVYETGAFAESKWKNAEAIKNPVYVMKAAIESFMILK